VSPLLSVRLPTVTVDGLTAALVVGGSEAGLGNRVQVETPTGKRQYWVAGSDTLPLPQVPDAVLQLFGQCSREATHDLLCRHYGTGLPLDVTVTLYTFSTAAPEQWEFNEYV
jgi:hypothetical protein